MSKISTIYDTVLSSLGTVFSTKYRIPNPYSLTDNVQQFLENGYGLRFEGSERLSYEICNRRERGSFTFILTKILYKIDTTQNSFDDPTKSLLEDVETFKQEFYSPDNLNLSDIITIDTPSVSSIQSLQGEKYNLLFVDVSFLIDYFETV